MKNVLVIQATRVQYVSDTYEGRVHDMAIATTEAYTVPAASELIDDLGFQGYQIADVTHLRPVRTPRGGSLTDDQRSHNRWVAQRRIIVEHVISSIKRCRILKDTLRLWKEGIRDQVMAICCGLHNFRTRINPWPTRDAKSG